MGWGDTYQCKGPWNDQCVVNMTTKVCTFKRWELTGIPCKHVVAAIYNMSSNGKEVGIPEDWVSQCYLLNTWKEIY